MLAFVNEHFIEESEASIGISDLALQRGYGIFDFFRMKNDIPLFLDDYIDRFYRSASLLRLSPLQSREELRHIIDELIRRNDVGESGIRMILTGGYSPDSFEPTSPNLIIIQQPLQMPDENKFEKGLKLVLHEYMRDAPDAKSINYLVGILARKKVVDRKADDVLYHKDGLVLELPRSNVFIVTKDETIVTPATNVLHGITRKYVLEIGAGNFKVEERDLQLEELRNAAEVFITSTTKRLIPIVAIDGIEIGNGKAGPVTRSLLTAFLEMEKELLARHYTSV
jgi:D-alanine transaminase/branched-chain amino acid aminotransferase